MSTGTHGRVLPVPDLSLVVLIGTTGSGKSTFARRHFKPTEVISSDFCRGLVADDENDQSATADAFDVLHYIAGKRLAAGRLTVVDATNVQPESRRQLVALAREHDVLPIAIVLDVPERSAPSATPRRPDRAGHAPAGDPAPAARAAPLAAFAGARGLPQGAHPARRRARWRPPRSSWSGATTTCGTSPGRSTSSATSTAAVPSWRRC